MTWLLYLFPAFRRLQAELLDTQNRCVGLQDRNIVLQTKCDMLTASEAESRASERGSMQRICDMLSVNSNLGSMFGTIETPERRKISTEPQEPAFVTGRQFVDQKTQQFFDEAEKAFLGNDSR